MNLPDKLVSRFAKILKPEPTKKKEETLYGTIVQKESSKYVQIDGSDYLAPIATTVKMRPGERVTVMIKNHSAIVTGNITSPAAGSGDIDDVVNTLEERTNRTTLTDFIYPVGSIYMSVSDVEPEVIFGGKWERIRNAFLYGAGTYAVGSTGGEAYHTLTKEELPNYDLSVKVTASYDGLGDWSMLQRGWEGGSTNSDVGSYCVKVNSGGGNVPHNNMPPYLVVNIWKRIE